VEQPELSRPTLAEIFDARFAPRVSEPTRELPPGMTFVQTIIPPASLAQPDLVCYQIIKDGVVLMQVITELRG
jgi:hypothetical protein